MIILGAGLAGLSAAYHLDGSVVYEQSSRVGGHAKSIVRDGFVFDEGIHVLHTKNDYVLNLLNGPAHSGLETHEREAWIYHYNAYTRYPFQANTYGLPPDIVKECLLGFIQNDFPQDAIQTYADWMYYQFGKGICDRFMVPYSTKFWGVPPTELTTEWVSVRHPRPSLDEVLTGALQDQTKGFGVNANFLYPEQGGFGSIGEALANAVGRDRIHLNRRVTQLDVVKRVIEFNQGEVVLPYEHLISTLPLPTLVNLIPTAPEAVREAASLLRTNSIFVVNLGIDRPDLTSKHWIYYPEDQFSFFRISFPMNQGPVQNMVPPGKSSIACEIAYGNGRPLDRAQIVERVITDLKRGGILRDDDRIIFQDTVDIPYAYIVFDRNRKPAVQTIHEFLKAHHVWPCGRYGDWGYLWSDEAILSGRRTAQSLQRKLSAQAELAPA